MPLQAHANGTYFNDDNLVGYFHFLADGTDSSGSGHTLSVSGSPTFSGGCFGNGGVEGTSAKYMYNSTDNLGIAGGNITVSLWFKTTVVDTGIEFLFYQANNTSPKVQYYMYTDYTNNRIDWARQYDGSAYYCRSAVPSIKLTGRWINFIGTCTGSTLYSYVNGVVTGPVSCAGTGTTAVGNEFAVFRYSNLTNAVIVSELIVADRVWTAAECALYYARNCQQYGTVHP